MASGVSSDISCNLWRCAIDWIPVSPSPDLCIKILIPHVIVLRDGVFSKWLGLEGRALMTGISALMKETPKSSFTPSTTQQGDSHGYLSPNTESAKTLFLDFLASRNKILLYQLKETKTGSYKKWKMASQFIYNSKCLFMYFSTVSSVTRKTLLNCLPD